MQLHIESWYEENDSIIVRVPSSPLQSAQVQRWCGGGVDIRSSVSSVQKVRTGGFLLTTIGKKYTMKLSQDSITIPHLSSLERSLIIPLSMLTVTFTSTSIEAMRSAGRWW